MAESKSSKITNFYAENKRSKAKIQKQKQFMETIDENEDADPSSTLLKNLSSKVKEISNSVILIQKSQQELSQKQEKLEKRYPSDIADIAKRVPELLDKYLGDILKNLSAQCDQLNAEMKCLKQMVKKNLYSIQNMDDSRKVTKEEESHDNKKVVKELNQIKEDIKTLKKGYEESIKEKIEVKNLTKSSFASEDLTLWKLKKLVNKDDDLYYLSTISLNNIPKAVDFSKEPREVASAALRSLGLDGIPTNDVRRVSLNVQKRKIRLTALSPDCARYILRQLCQAKRRRIQVEKRNVSTTFSLLSPPRWNKQRDYLYKLGLQMKEKRLISHFHLFPLRSSLAMKTYNKENQVKIIQCPESVLSA